LSDAPRAAARRRLLHPGSWPVRWRLAAASAGLTLAILLVFGAAIGTVATQRIRDDFNGEVESAVQTLAAELRIVDTPTGSLLIRGPGLNDYVLPNDATVRVFDSSATLLTQSTHPADLGPLHDGLHDYGGLRVATARIGGVGGDLTGYVQYGRSVEQVDSTVERVWLLIVAGGLGGTLLASLAGMAIAARAMRPVAALTATAREISATRDPSRRMPKPAVADEVGELALTLEEMLRSLDAARGEREAAMQQQREFVADASHELRTPLTSVLANLELLQASLAGPAQAEDREVVDSALRSSRRMSRLVSDLLLLARADAGRLDGHRRCDLAEVVGDAAAEAAPLLAERQLRIDNVRPLRVEGSPDELHRMVLNLLGNAAHHTPPGSRVELAVRAEDGCAVIEVGDDGPGIPLRFRKQIFDRFVRGEGPADTAAGTGTGLGLAIAAAVVESHRGTIEVGDSPRGGALFRVRIPLAKADETVSGRLGPL
jgi:two-component system OmpR family sensor kinase